ncbi:MULTISPECIES: alpha/beta hydrolase family protein [unclassified Sphingobium]|uniref:alpha/beta hydrolase family protein n=1 Tax=unclassified Sphingobium TaxID=2611147 RepID=UPI000D15BBBD|nr:MULTISPECIES: alpha/beta fold hydrolase [unclassified Sphingobium]MBG6119766.1 dienelactone hydrolase [Sphingobium sp. JAI105]PSO10595.1 alpha/beta hydrolase [Sphingobium sp. AEW4]TWD01193.1 prolyl oligopeptidase family protein [Sphingobium sp. AEW010]TWD19937.1 prolyl oligopeptidase family protein [Sphingobium sp. AEW013]TWD22553.1 prolyl oligopeptidase family protein [Sphingobium sp. AEW001]
MALFEYFPNYIWNLSVAIALESGGRIGEIVDMCQPIRDAAANGGDAGTPQFMQAWSRMGDSLLELAAEDEAKGRAFSASNKLERASLYLFVAERMQGHGAPGRKETYAKAREAFDRSTALGKLNRERVEIPLETGTMPALFTRAPGAGKKPVVVFCNGLDSCKELLYWTNLPVELARRGISTLCVDQPGSGETLRLQGLPVDPHSESWASKAVDWLEQQRDVDPKAIGMTGISLGGHFAPRAVAYEPRFASGAVWGANHNWREVQDKRMAREGENPVPHYWAHVHWAFGAKDQDDFLAKSETMNLNGHMDRIKVPFLVTHGANDRQISVAYADDLYDQLVNSPRREKMIFTAREGGVEHVGADNMSYGRDLLADWFAQTLGGNSG